MHENRAHPDGTRANVIRFLWFNGASPTPLWDAGTLLPEDERWLRHVVGLSDALIGELKAWATARDSLRSRLATSDEAASALDARADNLVARLNAATDARFKVEHLH